MDFTPREVNDFADLQAIRALRLEAWKDVLPEAALVDMNNDPMDDRSRHWVVSVEGSIVAAARLSIHSTRDDVVDIHLFEEFDVQFSPPVGSLNRAVVHQDFRKRGLARLLDAIRIEAAKAAGCKSLLSIRLNKKRADDLCALGFELVGHTVDRTSGPFHGMDCFLLKRDFDVGADRASDTSGRV